MVVNLLLSKPLKYYGKQKKIYLDLPKISVLLAVKKLNITNKAS